MARRSIRSPSAALLLYRRAGDGLSVLLIHPGGPFWRNKDAGAWQLPKGMIEEDEQAESAARREFAEEIGVRIDAPLADLGSFRQAGGKLIRLFAAEGDLDPDEIHSNVFELEWPPRSGRIQSFPEVDRARWFSIGEARAMMLASQHVALDMLEAHLQVQPLR